MSKEQQRLNMIRLPEVCKKVGLSKPSIYRLMKSNDFPQSSKIGSRAIAWTESQIDEWILSKIAA